MKILFLVLLIFVANASHASESYLSCSHTQLRSYYVNGVLTTFRQALVTASRLSDLIQRKPVDEQGIVTEKNRLVTPLYNATQGKVRDTVESLHLKIRSALSGEVGIPFSIADILLARALFVPSLVAKTLSSFGVDPSAYYDIIAKTTFPESYHDFEDFKLEIKQSLNQNRKVLLFSHSEGTIYATQVANEIRKEVEPLKQKLLFGLMFAPAIQSLPQSNDGKERFSYILNAGDFITLTTSLFTNMRIISCDSKCQAERFQGHSINDIYLNDGVWAEIDGVNAPIAEHFWTKLRSVLRNVPNNSAACCNGRDGKIWSLCDIDMASSSTDCLGGFVEARFRTTSAQLKIEKGARLCSMNNATPTLQGNLHVSGKVGVGLDTKIMGPSGGNKRINLDAGAGEILIGSNSTIIHQGTNDLDLKDDLIISHSTIIGGGIIKGSKFYTPPQSGISEFRTSLADTKISGDSIHLQGSYVFSASTSMNPFVEGEFESTSAGFWNYMYIGPSANVDGSNLRGIGFIEGRVGDGANVFGYKIVRPPFQGDPEGVVINGVVVDATSSVLGDSRIEGSVELQSGTAISGNSQVTGNKLWFYPSGGYDLMLLLSGAIVQNSTIEGGGVLYPGAFLEQGSLLSGCGFGAFSSHFINTTFYNSGTTYLPSGTYQDMIYGSPSDAKCDFEARSRNSIMSTKLAMKKVKTVSQNYTAYLSLRGKYPIPDACLLFGCAW